MSQRHHVIISGTGRAGTTFLVKLLTRLGLDTGYDEKPCHFCELSNAGMEEDINDAQAPYIVKSPWFCDTLPEVIGRGEVVIDHAIIPIRELFAAAESRRYVTRRADPNIYPGGMAPGGLWHTAVPEEQESILTERLYSLIYTLTKNDIPMTLIHFPRIVNDEEYLQKKLLNIFPETSEQWFKQCFKEVAKPELVHTFHPRNCSTHPPSH